MNKNTRAGLIPEIVLKDIMYDSNKEWHCKRFAEIAGRRCESFDSCVECIDFTLDWFYGDEAINYDV